MDSDAYDNAEEQRMRGQTVTDAFIVHSKVWTKEQREFFLGFGLEILQRMKEM